MKEFEASRRRMRKRVGERLRKRSGKYRLWLTLLPYAGFFLRDFDKGSMLEADYYWMREIDDVADGDLVPPIGYSHPQDYVAEKLEFLVHPQDPRDDVEMLMRFCNLLSESTGLDLSHARQMIVESMLFDAQRLRTGAVFSEDELRAYFFQCDIEGTIAGALPLFGEDPEKWVHLYELGQAVRIYYNLRDLNDDVHRGLVNISQQDMAQFGITKKDLENLDAAKSPAVENWFKYQAQQGLDLLNQGNQSVKEADLNWLGRFFIYHYHQQPAGRFFQSVLANKL